MQEITWTNCSILLPPNTNDLVIVRQWNHPDRLMKSTGIKVRCELSFPNLWEFTPHTDEKWKELNK